MHITLTPELEQIIKQQTGRGSFPSPKDLVRAALSQLEADEGHAPGQLNAMIQAG